KTSLSAMSPIPSYARCRSSPSRSCLDFRPGTAALKPLPKVWTVPGRFRPCDSQHDFQGANGGKLEMPVLFLHGAYDAVCETTTNSRFADPMRRDCHDLNEG